jgi:cytochrome c oxidase assembly factor CtaG
MTTWRLLISGWHWHPSVLLGSAALLLVYAVPLRFRLTRSALLFAAGILALLIALLSPLHTLGDSYLFSAHMLQHLLLLLLVPPLLLLGIPPEAIGPVLRWRALSRAERLLGHPLVAWSLGLGAMWLWHLPALYNAALEDPGLHIVEHLCFLVTAAIFWWPVVAPVEQSRLAPLAAMLYLFAAMIASSLLGIILTFAPPGLYPIYLQGAGADPISRLLRDGWGLSPAADQQLGGLLMWVPGGLVYLCAIIGTFARWYSAPDMDEETVPQLKAGEPHAVAPAPHRGRKLDVT